MPIVNRRKLRKLWRDPEQFLRDAISNAAPQQKLRELRDDPREFATDIIRQAAPKLGLGTILRARTQHSYTIISAVYNVEKYLGAFLESVTEQSIELENLQLIMVNDGSTDDSVRIIEEWSVRYPGQILLLHKENGGQASARNLGLKHATGDWVTFVDPDDYLHRRYFETVDKLLCSSQEDVALVCCKWLIYHERNNRTVDNHPLTFRFRSGNQVLSPDNPDFMASSASTSFFLRSVLTENNLEFDESIRPNFEDGHFSGQYLVNIVNRKVGYSAKSVYYYRKRADGSSTTDTSWEVPSRFSTVLSSGYIGLFNQAKTKHGYVPLSIQRLVLYDVFWYFKRIINHENSVSFLTEDEKALFLTLLREVFTDIEPSTIMDFTLSGIWLFQKVGILGFLKASDPTFQKVYIGKYDPVKRLAKVTFFFYGKDDQAVICVNGQAVKPAYKKTRVHHFLGNEFVNERFTWIQLPNDQDTLSVSLQGIETTLSLTGTLFRDGVRRAEIEKAYVPRTARKRTIKEKLLLRKARSAPVRDKFKDSWMLLDRDTQADDNAEHLYRHILNNHPDINAFFVLLPDSHDWKRLQEEGFRLIAYGSQEHQFLMLNAIHIVSSHPDSFVLNFLDPRTWRDQTSFKFTFLQHGVIRDDISNWLNPKNDIIDLFVTSSPAEHESIAGDVGNYVYSKHQTKMVGLSRHDALLERKEPTEKVVLLMPTWRAYLVGATSQRSTKRSEKDEFFTSRYAMAWRSLLHSDRLRSLTQDHGYRVIFFPHANMQLYADWFDAPDWVEVHTHQSMPVLQKLYRSAKIMVTDYSSVFFEMALLRKAILYYQFDLEEMYGGAHTSRLGYFEFERDGFGPVTYTEEALLNELTSILKSGGLPSPNYLKRMETALPLQDGQNRERTVQAIKNLYSPDL